MSNWRIVVSGSAVDPETSTSYSFNIQQWPGAGMPPIQNISTDFGYLDGAIFQRQRVPATALTLTGIVNGSSVADLHTKRRNLINAVKPDRSASQEAVVLQYLGSGSTRQASAFFEGGLELGEVDVYREKVALRFVQFDPCWESTTSSSATLTVQSTVANANSVMQRAASGGWGALGSGFNSAVYSIASASDGSLIFGGAFTTASGAAACRIAKWNNGFSNIGSASAFVNGEVNAVAVGRDGYIYAGGTFTSVSGTTCCQIARYTGTGWTTWGGGIGFPGAGNSSLCNAIAVDSDGNVLVAGIFSQASSVAACGIAKWTVSSSAWSAIASGLRGNGGNTATSYEIALNKSGDIWVSGQFDAAGLTTNTACNIAVYTQSTSAWTAPGGSGYQRGSGGGGAAAAVISDGTVYFGGEVAGTTTGCFLYSSNGIGLTALTPTSGAIRNLYADPYTNTVYVQGATNLTQIKGTAVNDAARIVNGTVTSLDFFLPSHTTVQAVHSASDGVLTIGFNGTGTASVPGVTTVTNNGTATAYPILTASAPTSASATMSQLVNYTTGDRIYFNLNLSRSEVVTLDLRPGKRTLTSNFRGDISSTILPGSNVTTWRLIPGANNVSFWLTGGSGAAKLTWIERFWSAD